MLKILGFFNLFFGILEMRGLYKYCQQIGEMVSSANGLLLNENFYKIFIYPMLLLLLGLVNLIFGFLNLGAMKIRGRGQEISNILIGSFLIFTSAIIFWDLIIT